MPIQKRRLNRAEELDYRKRVHDLREQNVRTGPDVLSRPPRLILKQIFPDFARIYELAQSSDCSQVILAVPVEMIVPKPGLLIAEVDLYAPWDGDPLDLDEPAKPIPFYDEVINDCQFRRASIVNKHLRSNLPLRPQRIAGLIVGHGWTDFPSACHDESLVTAALSIIDGNGDELYFELKVRVDRNFRRKCDRDRQQRSEWAARQKSTGPFGPAYPWQNESQRSPVIGKNPRVARHDSLDETQGQHRKS